jgi:hypothetical protein
VFWYICTDVSVNWLILTSGYADEGFKVHLKRLYIYTRLEDIKTQKTITDPTFIAILFKLMLILIYYRILSFSSTCVYSELIYCTCHFFTININ